MKYPRISRSATLQIAQQRRKNGAANSQNGAGYTWWMRDLYGDMSIAVKWWGEGTSFNETLLEDARHEIEALIRGGHEAEELDRDQTEGKAACLLYQAIEDTRVETSVLDDPGFWRYITLACLWNFTVWREHAAFSASIQSREEDVAEPSNRFNPYIDGQRSTECLPARMYLRIRVLGGLEYGHLAWAVKGGTDFWRSHILRVKAGEHPPLVRAIVMRQAEPSKRLLTGSLRVFAKELNRTLVNLVPDLLDDETADDLVAELWERQLTDSDRTHDGG